MSRKKVLNHEIYNTIIKTAGLENRLPMATRESMQSIGNNFMSSPQFEVEQNIFISSLINKIGLSLIRTSNIKNEFSDFIYYGLEFGDIIEEMFVQPALAEDFDFSEGEQLNGSSVDPYRITVPDTKATYFSNTVRRKYRVTTMKQLLKKAFYNEYGLDNLIGQIVNSLSQGATLDEREIFKDILNNAITQDGEYALTNFPAMLTTNEFKVHDKQSALMFVQQVKNKISDMLLPSGEFNVLGAIKQLTADDLVIFLRKDIATIIETELLSSAFHRDDLDFTPSGVDGRVRVILIDDFGGQQAYTSTGTLLKRKYDNYGKFQYFYESSASTPYTGTVKYYNNYMNVQSGNPTENVACLICEKSLPVIAIQEDEMTSTYNGEALYINTVLHRWRTYGYSRFANYTVIKEPYSVPEPSTFEIPVDNSPSTLIEE